MAKIKINKNKLFLQLCLQDPVYHPGKVAEGFPQPFHETIGDGKDLKAHLVPTPFCSIPISDWEIPQLEARLFFQSFWLKTILDGQSWMDTPGWTVQLVCND